MRAAAVGAGRPPRQGAVKAANAAKAGATIANDGVADANDATVVGTAIAAAEARDISAACSLLDYAASGCRRRYSLDYWRPAAAAIADACSSSYLLNK